MCQNKKMAYAQSHEPDQNRTALKPEKTRRQLEYNRITKTQVTERREIYFKQQRPQEPRPQEPVHKKEVTRVKSWVRESFERKDAQPLTKKGREELGPLRTRVLK